MNKPKTINNMKLKLKNTMWEVTAPTKVIGRHPSYYTKVADFVHVEDAIMFMKVNLSYVSAKTRERKSTKWIAIGLH